MDLNTQFGLFAAAVGALDLAFVYFRGESLAPKVRQLRIAGAIIMFALAALMLLRIVKLA